MILSMALLTTACDAANEEPPPREFGNAPSRAPPVVDPPDGKWCPPYPSGKQPPPEARSAEKCARIRAERDRAHQAAREKERRDYVKPEFVSFAERQQHPLAAQRSTAGWINRLQPIRNGVCRFTEKPRGSVPAAYIRSAWSGNMDLWNEWDGMLHDHAIGFVEASFGSNAPVIAVRQGLPDLWIEPVGDPSLIILFIGEERFQCVRRKPRINAQ
ncbi:MAG: hypothetical protein LC648_09700 [Novosphingobium sp.]|nr:hypothetical protein [Novosphingobium sp.]